MKNDILITGLGTATPEHVWTQTDTLRVLSEHSEYYRRPRVQKIFHNSGIATRSFVRAPEGYDPNAPVAQMHTMFSEEAPKLAKEAAEKALSDASLTPADLTMVIVATCTGYLCPGLSAYLSRDLDLPSSVQRGDLVGMGCAGAMPALQRGHDHVGSRPGRKALVVAVEVCSTCCFLDETFETAVGNAICGDGAAALVLEWREEAKQKSSPSPTVLSFESVINTGWLDAVGLQNRQGKHRIVLSKEIRKAAGPASKSVVDKLLKKNSLARDQISHWVFHAGGAAVLTNIESALGFDEHELQSSRAIFKQHGNMSSPTTLFVLQHIHQEQTPQSGEFGVALALGPGLATEAALLRW